MNRRHTLFFLAALALALIAFGGGYCLGRGSMAEMSIVTERQESPDTETSAARETTSALPTAATGEGLVHINTATAEELATLPGIGETLAQRIVDYRQQYGPFQRVEELANVSGIGEGKLSAILAQITVD